MPDVELDQQQAELRAQVLSAALSLALRAADVGESTDGAAHIQLAEEVSVATVTWKLRAQWNGPFAAVRLTGRPPRRRHSEEDDGVPFAFLLIFGAADEGNDGSFDFTVPVAWLRDAARAHDPRTA